MEPTPAQLRPSFALLGADAFLAARPATPVQLAHACTRGGYDAAIPATWGDEIIAERCIERLAERTLGPAVFCACSYVRDRLLAPGPDLAPFMLSFVAPPVAAARYLRQLYAGRPIDITYVGACPSADDEAIDRQVAPKAFFAELRARGIILSQQPTIFNSMFAPDRRRCLSQPGGLPTPQLLERQATPREVVDIAGFEYAAELAQHLILNEPVLLDLSTRSGCACSGAAIGIPPNDARSSVVALEPPRSAQPIVEHDLEVPVDFPIPVPTVDRGPPPRDDPPGRGSDRPVDRPVASDLSDFPDWPQEIIERFTRHEPPRPTPRAPDAHEFRAAAPLADVVDAPRAEMPRAEMPREPRLELRNFESQFEVAFRSAFVSVPMALPIPRQPATETFDFPLFDREVPIEATAEVARRRTRVPRARSAEGRTLPRAYVAHRAASPPAGELVVRTARPPAPVAPRVEAPAPITHMPLFAAFAASGVLSASTQGDTALTRQQLPVRAQPAAITAPVAQVTPVAAPVIAPERTVPITPTVETPARRRSAPALRKRVVQPPRGLALIGHWLRQVRFRHLAALIIGLVAIVAAIGYFAREFTLPTEPTPTQIATEPLPPR